MSLFNVSTTNPGEIVKEDSDEYVDAGEYNIYIYIRQKYKQTKATT